MKTSFDLNSIVFRLLNSEAGSAINGGIYTEDDRPADSDKEDIVINTIDSTQAYLPQIATSNVNIYVPDSTKNINGKNQMTMNKTRLNAITKIVLRILREAHIDGLALIPVGQTTLSEPDIDQHFVNIRIEWNIQID